MHFARRHTTPPCFRRHCAGYRWHPRNSWQSAMARFRQRSCRGPGARRRALGSGHRSMDPDGRGRCRSLLPLHGAAASRRPRPKCRRRRVRAQDNPALPNQPNPAGDSHADAQIFTPPYLLKGPRPTIAVAPAEIIYGQVTILPSEQGTTIAKVSWVRLGSVTHSCNQNQLLIFLMFNQAASEAHYPGAGELRTSRRQAITCCLF